MTTRARRAFARTSSGLWLVAVLAACTPRVVVEAPKEPITINMNIKIEHEIRLKVDKDLDAAIDGRKDIF